MRTQAVRYYEFKICIEQKLTRSKLDLQFSCTLYTTHHTEQIQIINNKCIYSMKHLNSKHIEYWASNWVFDVVLDDFKNSENPRIISSIIKWRWVAEIRRKKATPSYMKFINFSIRLHWSCERTWYKRATIYAFIDLPNEEMFRIRNTQFNGFHFPSIQKEMKRTHNLHTFWALSLSIVYLEHCSNWLRWKCRVGLLTTTVSWFSCIRISRDENDFHGKRRILIELNLWAYF